MAHAFRSGKLPWKLNDAAAGLNGQMKVPKRNWNRGGLSGSMSRQMQHTFMWQYVDALSKEHPSRGRCLDWDGWYGGSIFRTLCDEVDVLIYAQPFGRAPQRSLPRAAGGAHPPKARWWYADAHSMASYLPNNAFDLIIANSVFEHIERPFVAMRQVYALLRPGGRLFWHTPFYYEMHGVPHDYYRYTAHAARLLAEASGLNVEYSHADGGYPGVLGHVVGLSAKFFSTAELTAGTGEPRHGGLYLSTRMVARKASTSAPAPAVHALGGEVERAQARGRAADTAASCAPVTSAGFAASVRRAWRNGRLPLGGGGDASTSVLGHLRHRFWQRTLAAEGSATARAGTRRCLHWAPAQEGGTGTAAAALHSLCDELITTTTLEDINMPAGVPPAFDVVLSSAAFSRTREPLAAMKRVAELLRARSGRLLWHEPFSRADQGGGDLWRFTTSAARSVASSSGLDVVELSADGGYGAVLCDTIGLPPNDTALWGDDGLSRGADVSTQRGGGHYLATAMIARCCTA